MDSPASEQQVHAILDQVLGYLNFSSGNSDPKFLSNLNQLYAFIAEQSKKAIPDPADQDTRASSARPSSLAATNDHLIAQQLGKLLSSRLDEVSQANPTFRDASQARSVISLTFGKLLSDYRKHHRDLLFHQSDQFLFNSFFVGRAIEAILRRDTAWDQEDQIVHRAIDSLNDFIGHRPVATLESQKIEPYPHEWIRPVPIYIHNSGVACGRYQAITEKAIEILNLTDPHLLRAAHFDPEKMSELAIDPRAFDFDHPINQRPNHHFGQWDEHSIDGNGFFRRFIVHQVTLDALLERVDKIAETEGESSQSDALSEAAAVMAGTMLMGSGISGSGPGTYDSNTTLATLLPTVAGYRDQFYADLLGRLQITHRDRLVEEASAKHQPFGGARQDLNARLAQRRASQLVNCRLAAIYARMGYPVAAEEQSKVVPVAAARIICQIDCLLSAANDATGRGELDEAFGSIPKIMSRLKRGIHCGAIVDPWNILGFDANYSLFPAVENSVRDHRVFELVDVMERVFALCSRLWSEAAANDEADMCAAIRKQFQAIVTWWRQYAAHEVMAVDAVDADDIFQAAELVAEALGLWQQGGAEAGDIGFWAQHADMFDSPKAYALVIDALMQRADYQTSTALLVHWMSQAEYIPLQHGDSSFHNLVYRWISEQKSLLRNTEPNDAPPEEIWNRIRKFHDFVEANAGEYWDVPTFDIDSKSSRMVMPLDSIEDFEEIFGDPEDPNEDEEDIYGAAYDDVSYTDSTDDGNEGETFDSSLTSDDAIDEEVDRVHDRLEFHGTISEYWCVAATIPLPVIRPSQVTESISQRLVKRRDIIRGWVEQAALNRGKLLELLDSINQYALPSTGSDHDAMLLYDQYRVHKDGLLDQAIHTCIETENAIRMLAAVIQAINHLVDGQPLSEEHNAVERPPASNSEPSSDDSTEPAQPVDPPEKTPPEVPSVTAHVNGGAPVANVYSALLIQDPKLVVENFPALIEYLQNESLLYVPLAKGGHPREIVRARVVQTAILDLLRRMPTLGLIKETYELTRTTLAMERNNPIGRGAVTEFDEIFEVAYSSMVHVMVQSTAKLKLQRAEEGLDKQAITDEYQSVLFDCIEMLTETMLMLWLDHSRTLRLSVLEKVHDKQSWQDIVEFIQNYGNGLFTQQFLHLGNIRAI
ncbi:MAG: hypothetical protein ACI814_004547, partial [Mariniblastus sp.]